MKILDSIQSLDNEGIIYTQNKPIRVHASDDGDYICKYHTGYGAAERLFKEFVIVNFLKLWELPFAEFALIKINRLHLPSGLKLQKRFFDSVTFGSKKVNDAEDLNLLTEDTLVRIEKKSLLRETILRLILFDLWVSNEDRHHSNYNLLFTLNKENSIIYPIDHEACFNHGNFEHGIQQLNYEETLFNSSFFEKMFSRKYLKEQLPFLELKHKIYLCIRRCKDNLAEILNDIPPSWSVDITEKSAQLNTYLFDEQWIEDCWIGFSNHLSEFLSITKQ